MAGAEYVNLCYTMILDDMYPHGEAARVDARQELDKRLNDFVQAKQIQQGVKPEPEPFKLTPAMMAQLKPRPKPVSLKAQDSQ